MQKEEMQIETGTRLRIERTNEVTARTARPRARAGGRTMEKRGCEARERRGRSITQRSAAAHARAGEEDVSDGPTSCARFI